MYWVTYTSDRWRLSFIKTMKRLTKKILEEARAMERAWIVSNPDGDQEWYLREIAGIKGVEYISLQKKLRRRKKERIIRLRS